MATPLSESTQPSSGCRRSSRIASRTQSEQTAGLAPVPSVTNSTQKRKRAKPTEPIMSAKKIKKSETNVQTAPIEVIVQNTPSASQKEKQTKTKQKPDRISKALSGRLFLVDRIHKSDLEEEFSVLGNTFNLYKVTISKTPKCTCRDYLFRRKTCKHLYFVLVRALGVTENELNDKQSLTEEDVRSLLSKETITGPSSQLNERVQEAFHAFKHGIPFERGPTTTKDANGNEISMYGVVRRPFESETCPICFESMEPTEPIVWCQFSCGNNLHKECFQFWSQSKTKIGCEVTCVYCRGSWTREPPDPFIKIGSYYNFSEAV